MLQLGSTLLYKRDQVNHMQERAGGPFRHEPTFLALSLLVVAAFVLGSCQSRNEPRSRLFETLFLEGIVPQDVQDRVWVNIKLRELFTLPTDSDILLLNPDGVKVDLGGDIYLADFGTMQVLRFGPDGQYLNSYGTGIGQGPGELMNISDFVITNDSIVQILDPSARRVSYFGKDGTFLHSRRTDFPSVRMAATENGHEYLLRSNSEFAFESRSEAGDCGVWLIG